MFRSNLFIRLFTMWIMVGGAFAQEGMAPDELYASGMGAFARGDFSAAAQYLDALYEQFGAEEEYKTVMPKVLFALASCRFNLQQYDRAVEGYDAYLTEDPDGEFASEALYRKGSALVNLENYENAIEAFEGLWEQSGGGAYAEDSAFQAGMCHVLLEDYEAAVDLFDRFEKAFPDSAVLGEVQMLKARSLYELNRLTESLEVLKQLASFKTSLSHVFVANYLARQIGDLLFDQTEYEAALEAYQLVRTKQYLTDALARSITEAKRRMRDATIQAKQRGENGRAFALQQRYSGIISRMETQQKEIQEIPDYEDALMHRIGRCYFNMERYWEARVAFRRVALEAKDPAVREAGIFDLLFVLARHQRFGTLVEQADRYLSLYADNPTYQEAGRVEVVAFMRAEALVNLERFDLAEPVFEELLERYPDHVRRKEGEFYLALCKIMQEKFDEGITGFSTWMEQYPTHSLLAEVAFWKPIAQYYKGDYRPALEGFKSYLKEYPDRYYASEASYRAALCLYALEEYEPCVIALQDWLETYPDHLFKWEGLVTLGDALAALGRLDEAKSAYRKVGPEAGHFYFLSLTQCARVWKALDTERDYRQMIRDFARFIRRQPHSDHVLEATRNITEAATLLGNQEKAISLTWKIIRRYGQSKKWDAFGPLFEDLRGFYTTETNRVFVAELEELLKKADHNQRQTLSARLDWQLMQATYSNKVAESEVDAFLERYPQKRLGADMLHALGQYYAGLENEDRMRYFFSTLIKRYPDSRFADTAKFYEAKFLMQESEYAEALQLLDDCMYSLTDTTQLMEAYFYRGLALVRIQRYEEGIDMLKTALSSRSTPLPLKPKALLAIGDAHRAMDKPSLAIPFYQRIYVLYGAFTKEKAQAYLASASCFKALGDPKAAQRTYQEMVGDETLKDLPEYQEALDRIKQQPESSV